MTNRELALMALVLASIAIGERRFEEHRWIEGFVALGVCLLATGGFIVAVVA